MHQTPLCRFRYCLHLLLYSLLSVSCLSADGYFLVFLVDARHLDYSEGASFLKSTAKHPRDGSKNGDVGHAWIYLCGPGFFLEGGHSGELGLWQPRYWEGVMDNIRLGAKNPINYLWCPQSDGFFQKGNGGHRPTTAACFRLTQEQFQKVYTYIQTYDFAAYALTGPQCVSFVTALGKQIGIDFVTTCTLAIPKTLFLAGQSFPLWEDARYSTLSLESPDYLEKALRRYIKTGYATDVRSWYRHIQHRCLRSSLFRFKEQLMAAPGRIQRTIEICY